MEINKILVGILIPLSVLAFILCCVWLLLWFISERGTRKLIRMENEFQLYLNFFENCLRYSQGEYCKGKFEESYQITKILLNSKKHKYDIDRIRNQAILKRAEYELYLEENRNVRRQLL